jgi:protein gp37
MAETAIQWTAWRRPDGSLAQGFTFNPWSGCTKVSEGCAHCYAEAQSLRNPAVLGEWGPAGRRSARVESYWRGPAKWDAAAAALGERRRVFCASNADVFEGDDTMPAAARPVVAAARERLWGVVEATPHLDWLLLTKRPQHVPDMIPPAWLARGFPPNVWVGASVETRRRAAERLPLLAKIPARVRFASCEPLLEGVSLARVRLDGGYVLDALRGHARGTFTRDILPAGRVDWVIVGGESGSGARPFALGWARELLAECRAAGTPYFFKQTGEAPAGDGLVPLRVRGKGGDLADVPEDLRVREWPAAA